jgi:hypothetical protein
MLAIIAYIDPGSGSVMFQMLIASALGFIYLIRGYIQSFFRKVKAIFKK